jgi:hypothetical protein
MVLMSISCLNGAGKCWHQIDIRAFSCQRVASPFRHENDRAAGFDQSTGLRAMLTVKMPKPSVHCFSFLKPAYSTSVSISPCGQRRVTQYWPSRFVSVRSI